MYVNHVCTGFFNFFFFKEVSPFLPLLLKTMIATVISQWTALMAVSFVELCMCMWHKKTTKNAGTWYFLTVTITGILQEGMWYCLTLPITGIPQEGMWYCLTVLITGTLQGAMCYCQTVPITGILQEGMWHCLTVQITATQQEGMCYCLSTWWLRITKIRTVVYFI